MKTKNLFLLALLLLFSNNTFSQWNIGTRAGINWSTINYPGSIENPDKRVGTNIGLTGTYYFNYWLGGQIELLYATIGYKDKDFIIYGESTENRQALKIRSHYLDIPILAKIFPFQSNINLQVGPQIGFLLARNTNVKETKEILSKGNRPIDFGILFGAGYEFNNGFFIDGRYLLGITSIYKEGGNNFQNRSIQLSIGYNFVL